MASKRQKVFAGLFIVAAVAVLVATVTVIKGYLNPRGERYEVHFPAKMSVSGLKKGSTVKFKGVPIGTVAEVTLAEGKDGEAFAMAVLEIKQEKVRYLGRRPGASLVLDGLMGGFSVNLTARAPGELPPPEAAAWDEEFRTRRIIHAKEDKVTQILERTPEVIEQVHEFVSSANRIIHANESQLASILGAIDGLAHESTPRLLTLLDRADQVLRSADSRVLADGGTLDRLEHSALESLDSVTRDVTRATERMAADLSGTLAAAEDPARRALEAAQLALGDVRLLIREMQAVLRGNREALGLMVAEVRDAADALEQTLLEFKNNRSSPVLGDPQEDRRVP